MVTGIQGALTDARVWLYILGAVCQTDGYPNPVHGADTLFARYKKRFPETQGAATGGVDESASGPLSPDKLSEIAQ